VIRERYRERAKRLHPDGEGGDEEAFKELNEAYDAHANACLVKPVEPDEFADLIQTFAEFWLSTATLASEADPVGDLALDLGVFLYLFGDAFMDLVQDTALLASPHHAGKNLVKYFGMVL
jgi:hypothetical protein